MENPAVTPVHPVPTNTKRLTTLLLGDTDGSATATSGLGVLTTDTETPVVSETTVGADLLQALEILTELGVDTVGKDVGVLAIDDIALSVQEPGGDLVLGRVLDDGDDSLELFRGELTGAVKTKLVLVVLEFRCSPLVSHSQMCLQTTDRKGTGHVLVPLVQIDIGLLADQVRVSATDTLDLGQGIHNLLLSVNIGVEETENLYAFLLALLYLIFSHSRLCVLCVRVYAVVREISPVADH